MKILHNGVLMKRLQALSILLLLSFTSAFSTNLPTISEKTQGFDKHEGYFTYYWDEKAGKLWLEIDKFEKEFLYVNSLAAGVGSNDIGLDRNQLGDDRVVFFERRGPKILLVQPNYSYRAVTDNKKEQASVRDAFAHSVLWGFKAEAQENGRILVDATAFLLRDAHGVADRLKRSKEGNFSVDDSRSAVFLKGTINFPQNTEFEATLTFAGSSPGGEVRSVTPTPDAITVRQHHSFIQLPDEGYEPRVFDPRAGYFGISYQDYSSPIGEPLTKRFINRHRLEKKDPAAKRSEPVEPIVYYLDPGTPEPVRSALLEGARWWNEAFEAAGYINAFRVEMLPDSAHPLDVRYNVINWVHRSTRGWSYGSSVVDPRTGEIIKGHVLLGSLRVRQDYLIAEGLLAPYEDGVPSGDDPMLEMALARIRQLSAHEVGHTLGLSHNFAASVNSRSSVMDYPAPMVQFKADSTFDLSKAYDTGIGEWDIAAIKYGYQDFPGYMDEQVGLQDIIGETLDKGLKFISDSDARPQGGAHPTAHLWDNGKQAVEQLRHVMEVRQRALEQFSEANIRPGMPMAKLEDVLVPIYLYHRYQLEGTAKLIGGFDYTYSVRGDGQQSPQPIDNETQKEAVRALMGTLTPKSLRMPDEVVDLIPPRPLGYYNTRELFDSYTDPVFDPLAIAETAADLTVKLLLNPNRAARLVEMKARDESNMGLSEMIEAILNRTWKAENAGGYDGVIQNTVNHVVLHHLIRLAANEKASTQVRSVANLKLETLREWMRVEAENNNSQSVQRISSLLYGYRTLQQFKDNDEVFKVTNPLKAPPGSPIGSETERLSCGL